MAQSISRAPSAVKRSDRPPSAQKARRPLQRRVTAVLPLLQDQTQEPTSNDGKDCKHCIRTLCEHEEVRVNYCHLFAFYTVNQTTVTV